MLPIKYINIGSKSIRKQQLTLRAALQLLSQHFRVAIKRACLFHIHVLNGITSFTGSNKSFAARSEMELEQSSWEFE
jgi:hypothetical protein